MKTLTTQPIQNSTPLSQSQPAIDPLVAFLFYFSVLLPLINQNLKHLLQLLTTLQKLRKVGKRFGEASHRDRPTQKPKK